MERILLLKEFEWMHDGETYDGLVIFNQDGTLEARFKKS